MTDTNQIQSSPVVSASYVCTPTDRRCKYWAKVVRADDALPLPAYVDGAGDIPGKYLRQGDEVELFPRDWLLEGEEVSHRRARGWTYTLRCLAVRARDNEVGVCVIEFKGDTKDRIRAAGRKDLLMGAGDIAAMVRHILMRREGIRPFPSVTPATLATEGSAT